MPAIFIMKINKDNQMEMGVVEKESENVRNLK